MARSSADRARCPSVAVVWILATLSARCAVSAGLPAFPGAEGFGCDTPGGRGGRIIEVTNLNADGPGSLRAAVSAEGPRIVVFRVGGTIRLDGWLSVREPFLTIAGQTAPGDGICLRGTSLGVHTHDVVIRYLRVRTGDSPEGGDPSNRDCIDISGPGDRVYNVVIDHCSFCWSIDENVTTWYGPRNVTIQWCISSESLLDSLHPKGPHGMGMLLGSQDNSVTVHHCLLAHNMDRNALIGDSGKGLNKGPSVFDFRDNVIYNHGRWSCTSLRGTSRINYVGNYIKMGPDGEQRTPRGIRYDAEADQLIYVHGNVWPGRPEGAGERMVMGGALGPHWRAPAAHVCSAKPIPVPPVTTQPAAEAYESVLRCAGATRPVRDVIDARIVQETRSGTGRIIDSQRDVGGWPTYRPGQPASDSDHDGMSDAWEERYGLAANDGSDGPKDLDRDGYTNVEEYLNGTDPTKPTPGAPRPHGPVREQAGNEGLRFGKARMVPQERAATPSPRDAFVGAVKASGKDVADCLGLKLVAIPKGEYMKGTIKVVLSKPFEMAAYEVTQAQWTRVMGTSPWQGKPYAKDGPDLAASYVSWDDCQEFLARLNACGPRRYRLPSQAEWEYASRAGSASKTGLTFGEKEIGDYAWHVANTVKTGEPHPHPVGKKRPNAWGLYDMVGNVHEWCHDCYEYWYWRPERCPKVRIDPMGAKPGLYYRDYRVLAGGSFNLRAWQIMAYTRSHHRPAYRNFDAGLRVVRLPR